MIGNFSESYYFDDGQRMNIFSIFAVFITIAALASYVNYRYLKLPMPIGLMAIALLSSLVLVGAGALGFGIQQSAEEFLGAVDFGETLMKGMLSFLLFAGALNININDLGEQRAIIGLLATAGVIVSTMIIGTCLYFLLGVIDMALPYIYCLVFGALISPTDPIAVLSILKATKTPKSLATKIAGESLFNDGVGVVVFTILLGIATGGGSFAVGDVALLFLEEAVGGVVFGLIVGWVAYRLLRSVDNYTVEILITLALVSGGYALASAVHTSGPIAIVVAGLLIGNHGRRLAMSKATCERLDSFWELIDEILNALLFVWIGMEILVLSFTWGYLLVGLLTIPVALAARFLNVWSAVNAMKFRRQFSHNATLIMTWGGLRGGISIALALSLAASPARDLILAVTYVVVVFSILVQGLTIGRLVKS